MYIKIKQIIITIFLFTIIQPLSAQPEWPPSIIEKANTAQDTRYLKNNEKKVILYINLARADGKLFTETYLKRFMDSTGIEPDSYTKSLMQDLKNTQNLPMLHPEPDLYYIAREHAIQSGKSGRKGHQGFKKRFRDLLTIYSSYGENCYYGRDHPLSIVIKLLIDEGVKDLGHRFNMLDPGFNSIGVSIMPHKTHGYNCVIEFGRKIMGTQ